MPTTSEFIDYVFDLLKPLGPLSQRRMFGGHCVYMDGLPFAIIFDDTLYLKVGDSNREDFHAHGIHDSIRAFDKDPAMTISYYEAPANIMEDREELCTWARKAFAVALSARSPKGRSPGAQSLKKKKPSQRNA